MSGKVNIEGIDKADLVIALHARARAQGVGVFADAGCKGRLDRKKIEEQLAEGYTYFDYVEGRVLKCSIKGPEMDTWLYNRDNGEEAAEGVIEGLRGR